MAGRAPRADRGPRLTTLALLALAIVPFVNGLPNAYTYDDLSIVRDDPRLAGPDLVLQAFTTSYWGDASTDHAYRPVTTLSFGLVRRIFGPAALPQRAVNVALHAIAAVLLWRWLLACGIAEVAADATAALFAVATIHVEAVTSLVGRGELLAAAFGLGGLLVLSRPVPSPSRAAARALAGAGLLTAACLSKENAVTLAPIGLLALLGPGAFQRPRAALARAGGARVASVLAAGAVALGILAGARVVLFGALLRPPGNQIRTLSNPLAGSSGPIRAVNAVPLVGEYALRSLVPIRLSADRSSRAIEPLGLPNAGWRAALVALAFVAAAAIGLRAGAPDVPLGIVIFLVGLFPVSNVPFAIGTAWGERLAYLPSAGLYLAVAALFRRAAASGARAPTAAFLVVLASLAAATIARNRVWRDDRSLFASMVASEPRSAKARYLFASEAYRRGDVGIARRSLEEAVRLRPDYAEAWTMLGEAAWQAGERSRALEAYARVAELRPDDDGGVMLLARRRREAGDREGARAALDAAIRRRPSSAALLGTRASLLEWLGETDAARADWRRVVTFTTGEDRAEAERRATRLAVAPEPRR